MKKVNDVSPKMDIFTINSRFIHQGKPTSKYMYICTFVIATTRGGGGELYQDHDVRPHVHQDFDTMYGKLHPPHCLCYTREAKRSQDLAR